MQVLPTQHIVQNALRGNSTHGFIYLNNPKVGCSTIKSSLWTGVRGKPPGQDQSVHVLEGSPFANTLPEPSVVAQAFVFTFVRNPYERLVSAYLDKVKHRSDNVWRGFATRRGLDPEAEVSFDRFVALIASQPVEENDPHWRPQHLNTLYPFVIPNLLADLDSVDKLLPQVLARIFGASPPAVATRQSHATTARATWRSFYDDGDTLALVERVYENDFNAYGYKMDIQAEPVATALPRQSEHSHPGVARLAHYQRVEPAAQFAALNELAAGDTAGVLRDWVLGQRLRRPKLHQTTLRGLLQDNAMQIAASAYLRKVVAAKQHA